MKAVSTLLFLMALAATPAEAQNAEAPDDSTQAAPVQESAQAPAQAPAPATIDTTKKDDAPVRYHSGWATLGKDIVTDFIAFPKRPSTWVFLGIGAGAALATHPADDYVETHMVGNTTADRVFAVGKVVGSTYVQVASGVGLWVVGRYIVAPATDGSRTNKFSVIGFDLMRGQILSQAIVHAMKYTVRRDRPTGECCSFPSGHAATAFAAAAVLERHLGYRGSWPALAAATYVATSRLVDDRHWLSDVMMGAGIGTASGWTVVGTHGRGTEYALQPMPIRGGMMLAFTRVNKDHN